VKRSIVLLGPPATGKGTLADEKRSLLQPMNGDRSVEVVFKEIGEAIAT
jgi:predicted ATPase with chaperone activity